MTAAAFPAMGSNALPVVPRRPQDMPEARDELARWLADGGASQRLAVAFQVDKDSPNLQALQGEARHVPTADLVYVDTEMVTLLDHAAQSLPIDTAVQRLAFDHALIVLEHPLRIWQNSTDELHGLYLHDKRALLLMGQTSIPGRVLTFSPPLRLNSGPATRQTWPTAEQAAWRLIATTAIMLGDRIAVTSPVRLDRATRRRLQRQDLPLDPVQLITLRRPTVDETGGRALSPVAWTRRWITGGHWRNQFYPSTGEHRPKWISPYLKGPSDKPLIIRERVHHWRR